MADLRSVSSFDISANTPDDFDTLYEELRGVHGLKVGVGPERMEPGDQGSVVDLLTVACVSGGAVTVFLEIIRDLVESRRRGFALTIRHGGTTLEITADTLEEALPLLEELLGGS
ncbi:hypothetical protein [Streptomyces sp. NBC_01190]|uniref:effector-associated constant component EACC1 n=1 Tax=Streptomyces sp. NBC_01190 TaxID=2903767 RepID=UPI00386F4921|nr:hypothetical protein OG519_06225 [Streptomyces sp. NBC_01190]